MSEGAPKQRLPQHINPRKLAAQGVELAGNISVSELPTLSQAAYCSGDARARLDFCIDDDGRLAVTGRVEMELALQCQRCMQPTELRLVEALIQVALVRDEEAAKQLPKAFDPWVVEEEDIDLYRYIEEELLLSLPVVAYHEVACVDETLYSWGDTEQSEHVQRDNPFSVLADLKAKQKDS